MSYQVRALEPHRVAYYLSEVAGLFHPYYKNHRVIQDDRTIKGSNPLVQLTEDDVIGRRVVKIDTEGALLGTYRFAAGTAAELVVVPAGNLGRVPDRMSWPEAAPGSIFDRFRAARALNRQWSLFTKFTYPSSMRS